MLNQEIYKRAIVSEGNVERFMKFKARAELKSTMNVAAIGGSITSGAASADRSCAYAPSVHKWIQKRFPNSEISFRNAGIGSTDSLFGVHRLETDVLVYHPELVIVEFAVNDVDNKEIDAAYESLIRRIIDSPSKPAVLLLFMMIEGGINVQDKHIEIGKKYSLPMISFRDAYHPEFESGALNFKEYYADNVHPNQTGHALVTELVTTFLDDVFEGKMGDRSEYVVPQPSSELKYMDAFYLRGHQMQPQKKGTFVKTRINPNGISCVWVASENGEPLEIDIDSCREIHCLYEKTNTGTGGKAMVEVCGQKTELDADFSNGWGVYTAYCKVFLSDAPQDVTIKVTPMLNDNCEFKIVGFMVS